MEDRATPKRSDIMANFKYAHLPVHLQAASRPFCELAEHLEAVLPAGAEKATALRKLLEAKDAGVRAALGGSPDAAKLWCVHVQGPDDIVATASRTNALELANQINAFSANIERTENDGLIIATVIEWHGTPESHAASLAEHKGEYQG